MFVPTREVLHLLSALIICDFYHFVGSSERSAHTIFQPSKEASHTLSSTPTRESQVRAWGQSYTGFVYLALSVVNSALIELSQPPWLPVHDDLCSFQRLYVHNLRLLYTIGIYKIQRCTQTDLRHTKVDKIDTSISARPVLYTRNQLMFTFDALLFQI